MTAFLPLLKKDIPFAWVEAQCVAFEKLKQCLVRPKILRPPVQGVPLYLYTTFTGSAMGAVLAQDMGGNELSPIYYISRVLQDAELREAGGSLARCVNKREAEKLLQELHAETCGQTGTVHIYRRLQRMGVYCPSMSAQASALQDNCADCQAPPQPAEVCTVEEIDWRRPYIDFIQHKRLPSDRQAALKIQKKAARFFIYEGVLYRRSYSNAALRCLSEHEAVEVMTRSHDAEHQGRRKLFLQLYEGGFYWKTIENDTAEHVRKLLHCQTHGNLIQAPHTLLHNIVTPWPFHSWGLDLIGTINRLSSKRHKYIITAMKYASKWVETIPLKDYAGANIAAFIKEHIIYRFGAPMIIITDNAKSFVNKDVIDLFRQYNISLHTSTPYYPKGNGQAEATNKTLICILSRILHDHHREWHEQLPVALWAYRISKHSSTGASPYSLVYGEDTILPAEMAIPSVRVAMDSHTTPDEISRFAHLDTIEERRARAERFAEAYRKRAANHYNQSVKQRIFKVEELVLKIAPHVQRNASTEKFSANWEGPFMIRKVAESGYYKLRRMNGTKVKTPINGKWLKKFYA
ncbi:protein NYNRIN-like [Papaver somniferum]|uniref:protein NYNRIN-like n=1 Tax=Papaver somniferum TaxID=3469 RepID=UPI000E6FC058|nr:protein NYNRIN-like [Papaver somniferum]